MKPANSPKQDAIKEEFLQLLRSTGRENIEEVIDYIDGIGFFSAPASASHHLAVEGGLVEHSLNTCKAALKVWEGMKEIDPNSVFDVKRDSIIIAALLHDVCKSDAYEKAMRRRKNELGQDELVPGYKPVTPKLAIGHGERSLVMLLYNTGLDLSDEEMMAIRWHMGPWGLNFNSAEENRMYDASFDNPLVTIVHAGDLLASRILENRE